MLSPTVVGTSCVGVVIDAAWPGAAFGSEATGAGPVTGAAGVGSGVGAGAGVAPLKPAFPKCYCPLFFLFAYAYSVTRAGYILTKQHN